MRICIPIETRPQGGGNNFIINFRSYLDAHNIFHTENIHAGYDILFTVHWMTPHESIMAGLRRNPKARIVQRIDGAAQDYGRDPSSDALQHGINLLADLTIFQSDYCRYSTREKFPVITHDGPVIHNPVDTDTFQPEGDTIDIPGNIRIVCATWSTNPMKGAQKIYQVAEDNPHIDFALCGRFPDAPELPNVHLMGNLGREELARVMRSCHALYFPSQNEACPNVVLEAMASGLPVLYEKSGATPELVEDCGLPTEVEDFRSQVDKLMSERSELSAKARKRAEQSFNRDAKFADYLDELESALRSPTAIPISRRTLMAWRPSGVLRYSARRYGRNLRNTVRSLRN
jgi:glycosyltransferase involved in cell wall biosynthesis